MRDNARLRKMLLETYDPKVIEKAKVLWKDMKENAVRIVYPEIVIYGAVRPRNGHPIVSQDVNGRIVPRPYNDKATQELALRERIEQIAADMINLCPFAPEGQGYMMIKHYKPIPSRLSDPKKYLCELGKIRPVSTPDLDNQAKVVCDVAKGILWRDDSKVVVLNTMKYFSARPRLVIQSWAYTKSFY